MTKEEFINTGLCEQYVLGLTTPEESEVVEQMLQTYPELKKDCLGLEKCMEKYAQKCPITNSAKKRKFKRNLKTAFPIWVVIGFTIIAICLLFLLLINWS